MLHVRSARRAVPMAWGLAIALSMLGSVAPAAPAPQPAITCQGDRPSEGKSVAFRREALATSLFAFAEAELGKPTGCRISWRSFDGREYGSIVFGFKDGSELTYEQSPPEVTVIALKAERALNLTQAQRALERQSGYQVGWSQTPEVRTEAGTEVRTYWHPEEGLNLGVDLVYRKGQLVGLGYHSAP